MKNYIKVVIGVLILSVGISLLMQSNLGLDPLSAFVTSLTYYSTISYGVMLTLVNIVFLIIHFIKYKDIKFSIIALGLSIIMGTVIDLLMLLIVKIPNTTILYQGILFIFGFILMSFGIAFIQFAKVQKLAFESFQLTIAESVNKDINFIRVFVEVGLAIIAIILLVIAKYVLKIDIEIFNTINIGTIIIMLLTGPTVNVMYKKILKGE